MNFQTKPTGGTKTYTKLLDDINSFWQSHIDEINKLMEDSRELERMFVENSNNELFAECKNLLTEKIEAKQNIILKLEEQLYILKRNFNIV